MGGREFTEKERRFRLFPNPESRQQPYADSEFGIRQLFRGDRNGEFIGCPDRKLLRRDGGVGEEEGFPEYTPVRKERLRIDARKCIKFPQQLEPDQHTAVFSRQEGRREAADSIFRGCRPGRQDGPGRTNRPVRPEPGQVRAAPEQQQRAAVVETAAPDRGQGRVFQILPVLLQTDADRVVADVVEHELPLRALFAVERVADESVTLGSFITVADATKCKVYLKNFGEFYTNQIETASAIILSRTDGMAEEKLDQCVAMIREHNKDAVIVTTPWPELTGEQLMEAMEQRSTIAIELAKLEEEAHHHHDHDDDDECDDPNCACHHHHHDDEEDEDEHAHEHHHHHHDDDEDEECDDPDCACHHHHDDEDEDEHAHHHHHHHHHGHDADEVFISWGEETHKKFTKAEIERILKALEDADTYGIVLRAKGYVANAEGEKWIHFDYVPGEPDIRDGGAMVTGRICVIGSKLNEEAVAALFGVEKQ